MSVWRFRSACRRLAALASICVGLVAVWSDAAFAVAPVTVAPGAAVLALGPHIELLQDRSGRLSLDQVRRGPASERFRPMAVERLRLDAGFSSYWLRFAIDGMGEDASYWLIEAGSSKLDRVDAYFVISDGFVVRQQSGDMRAFAERPVAHRLVLFRPPPSPDGRLDVYIRIANAAPGGVQPRLWRADAFFAADATRRAAHGVYFGLLIAVGLYAAFVYLSLRDPTYRWYALYVLSIGLLIFVLHGYGGQFLWPTLTDMGNLPIRLLLNAALLLPTPFLRSYLRVWEFAPRLDRVMRWHIAVGVALFVVIPWLSHGLGSLIVVGHGLLMQVTSAIVILMAFRPRRRQAAFMAVATALWLPGMTLLGLRAFGVVADRPAIDFGPELFTGLETILFAFALADRVRGIDAARRRAERRAAEARGRFSQRLIETVEQERRRIAGALHDSLGQKLTLIRMRLAPPPRAVALTDGMAAEPRPGDDLAQLADAAATEVRDIARDLHPYQIEMLGLSRAIEVMARDALDLAGIAADIEIAPADDLLPPDARTHLYRIAQEAVTNIVRHAGAGHCRIALGRDGAKLRLEIRDDGRGFDRAAGASGGFGLTGMAERARLLDGRIAVDARPGEGTRIVVTLPLDGGGT